MVDATALIERLYPICRSITGEGVRATLSIIGEHLPVVVSEVASGTPVLDWVVPPEWNIRDAYIADASGRRVVDFNASNLHIVSYSVPVHARMTLDQLRPHLHTLPDHPDWVPYRTSYYDESWGFCLSQNQLDALVDGIFEVRIDSTLAPGSLTYGEVVVPGRSDREILVSAHICHPSLCDDNLSGVAVAVSLAAALLAGAPPRHTFRFLFAPGTIGSITWLERNRERLPRIDAGLTLTCLGDDHRFTYKRTHSGDDAIDRCAAVALAESGYPYQLIDYFPYGYDERQYNSPGFRLPVGSLMRGRHGAFDEYHTSADDLGFVSAERIAESVAVLQRVLDIADRERTMLNLVPFGEPQLGRRGLYRAVGGTDIADAQMAMLWVLHLSDGDHSLLDIADRSGLSFDSIEATAELLEQNALVRQVEPSPNTIGAAIEEEHP
ncbi:MAG: DUF4910 domain-containing protein [Acidimicrobiia bacterium]|nr:DUF4910 domain-containing protein [Acidimicrobiia bacterium]